MPEKLKEFVFLIFLACAIFIAFMIRYEGVTFGLPDLLYPDEGILLNPIVHFVETGTLRANLFKNHIDLYYGPLYSNIITLLGLPIVAVLKISYGFSEVPVWIFYFLARLLNALLACVSLFCVYKIGGICYDKTVAFIGVLFLAFNTIHVSMSVYAKSDMLMSALVLITIIFIFKLLETQKVKFYILTGLFTGLSFASKLNAVPIIWPIGFVCFFMQWNKRKDEKLFIRFFKTCPACLRDKNIYALLFFVLIGYVVASPQLIVHYKDFWEGINQRLISRGAGSYFSSSNSRFMRYAFFSQDQAQVMRSSYLLIFKIRILVYCFFVGFLYSLFRLKQKLLILILLVIGAFLFFRHTLAIEHHHLVELPILCLIAAYGLVVSVRGILNYFKPKYFPLSKKILNNKAAMIVIVVICNSFLICSTFLITKELFRKSNGFINNLTGNAKKRGKVDAREWILYNIPVGARIAYFRQYGPFISNALYNLDENMEDNEYEYFKQHYDLLVINSYFRKKNSLPILFEDLKKIVPIKIFPGTSIFSYGLEIYDLDSKEKDYFQIKLDKFNLKKDDFASMQTYFKGVPGVEYILDVEISDNYHLSTFVKGYVKQRVLVNGDVLWEHDLGDEEGPQLKKNKFRFIGQAAGTNITVEVRAASPEIYPGWAKHSLSNMKLRISDFEDKEYPADWRFVARNGSIFKFKNLYTETLHINEKRTSVFNAPSFESDIEKNWIGKSSLYVKNDSKRSDLLGEWLTIPKGTEYSLVEAGKNKFSEKHQSLYIGVIKGDEKRVVASSVGQVIPQYVKDGLSSFSIDYYIDSKETKSSDFKILLKVRAESIGGNFLQEKIYTLFDTHRNNTETSFDSWHTFRKNIKRDFTIIPMNWDFIAFMLFTIEVHNYDLKPAGVYVDNIQTAALQ